MEQLTARQAEILDLIRERIASSGSPPTRAEIAHALGFASASGAEDHLRALARKGAIELLPGASRGIRLTNRAAFRSSAASLRATPSSLKNISKHIVRSIRLGSLRAPTICCECAG
jgi:repressor LexA